MKCVSDVWYLRKSGTHLSYHTQTHAGSGLRLEYFIWRAEYLFILKAGSSREFLKKVRGKNEKIPSQQLGTFLSLFSSGWILQSLNASNTFQKYHSQIPHAGYIFQGNHLSVCQRCQRCQGTQRKFHNFVLYFCK